MARVIYEGVSRIYGKSATPAVENLNLDIADGEFLVLVGPSGCGKSTSLRMLAGLEPTDRGRITIDGRDVTGVSPAERNVAMVFQNYALYPNMTVAQNMGFALRNQGVDKATIASKVNEAARILQLESLLERKPANLSGGQRQRVAMGRAIVRNPAVFCMDEPLSNLDAKLRVSTRGQISALQKRLGTTTVYVTHDQVEAMTMGDRVAVLKDGKLQQVASPQEIYERPANAFVAGFIGSPAMNFFEAQVTERGALLGELSVPLTPSQRDAAAGGKVRLGIRPEHLALAAPGAGLDGRVQHVEQLGYESYGFFRVEGAAEPVAVRMEGRVNLTPGEEYSLVLNDAPVIHIFDGEGHRVG
ncbi:MULTISPECIES: sn-glycerol-3-phosphate ABC transporter ATP-binding protein UgpC [unclassified Corynebacterium]|uniref:ABC transporter ATP-binding protein n=1 Tax=unclassified Corynebacterium TaxID=2624378 RepID=UPI0029CA5363|nr:MULTISPECIES: sn-glycerol-3-phosphate ABC transporter ATP-binding protein UgpC [unclassified Corynebacterium]WPF65689.1 sn-glycerol-3-phosphate ABC transporter ATP-binding protein UgpC [Corynebacterium sp. 22KM0430]WPF68185.1 sn-glycerol-3-phosphate ABC transporter ATP-binding protein UgpC [Corynebacterium sp. 21KM1197]